MGRGLAGVGEHAWLARLCGRLARGRHERRVLVPPGDDAAVLRSVPGPLVVTTDALVEGVHFRRGWYDGHALGARAFAVNASDLAAMGARPLAAVMALACPPRTPPRTLDAIVDGFVRAARRWQAPLVGGNLAAASELSITITLLGSAPGRIVRRTGARPGDALLLSGPIGGMGTAVRLRLSGRRARLPPVPDRVALGVALAPVAHAMIDVSDGLAQDLGHVCRASDVVAEVELGKLPLAPRCRRAWGQMAGLFAASAGEDYELLLAVAARDVRRAMVLGARAGCRLSRIGRCVAGSPRVRLLAPDGRVVRPARGGFDHFRPSRRYGR